MRLFQQYGVVLNQQARAVTDPADIGWSTSCEPAPVFETKHGLRGPDCAVAGILDGIRTDRCHLGEGDLLGVSGPDGAVSGTDESSAGIESQDFLTGQ